MSFPAPDLANNWQFTEIWVDPTSVPPYILMLLGDDKNNFCILDPTENYNSITEHRFRIKKDLQENPSFKNYLHEVILVAYADARKLAIKESKNAKLGVRKPDESEYPLDLPFTLQQLLDEDFYGDML
ncbi:MAG: DUF29 family protein [Dolichospermum sp.]